MHYTLEQSAYPPPPRPQIDTFQVWGSRVGKIEKIDIGFGRSKTLVGSMSAAMGDAWLLDSIQVGVREE